MRIRLEISGDTQLDRELLRFANRTDNMKPVLRGLADDFLVVERAQFSGEGAYSGGWAALSPAYKARKAKKYPGARILHAEGRLEASLTRQGARDAVRDITRDSLHVGTNTSYAGFHQTGTARMPRRRPVEFSAAQRVKWVKAIQRYLTTGAVQV